MDEEFTNFNLQGTIIKIPNEELELILSYDWYLTKLVQSEIDHPKDKENKAYILFENPQIFMDIIDSLRYHKVIISDEQKLNYYISLGEKWFLPEWFLDELNLKLEKYNSKKDFISNLFQIKQCKNCHQTYKESENHKDACQFHYQKLSGARFYPCCGHDITSNQENKFCCKGYHISDKFLELDLLKRYLQLEK
tara:strand:+ start:439 stop:1020 length:582 start_codon:yes stop_codon:yes gene_type:complete